MSVITVESPTTAFAEGPIQRLDVEGPTSWARAAARAHALLSQTMPDDEIDELVARTVPFDQAIVLPPFLFG